MESEPGMCCFLRCGARLATFASRLRISRGRWDSSPGKRDVREEPRFRPTPAIVEAEEEVGISVEGRSAYSLGKRSLRGLADVGGDGYVDSLAVTDAFFFPLEFGVGSGVELGRGPKVER